MQDPKFQFTQDHDPKRRSGGMISKVTVAAAAAALLVLAVMYVPLLWQNLPIAAGPGPLSQIAAPVAQLDSSLDEDQAALAQLYTIALPSVVNIQVEGTGPATMLPEIPGFQLPPDVTPSPVVSQGSGFIYDDQGHIITNNHVVDGADKVVVTFYNGMWADAEVVATDPQADLAVIKVTPPEGFDWKPLPLADDDSLQVGHLVIAIGNPFGLEGTMTTGIVSALGRSFPVASFGQNRYTLPDVIQTDAAINPGNSGGPLLDLAGSVVGVNFAIESQTRQNSGVGFVIPVSIVKRVVPELIADGKFSYAYLGLEGSTITPDLADALGLSDNQLGVYVSSVVQGGPSAEAGLQGGRELVQDQNGLDIRKGGDIITGIGDQPVRRFEDLVSYLVTKASPGDVVTLTILRDGQEQQQDVTLGERPTQVAAETSEGPNGTINARAAIAIAQTHVEDEQALSGEIVEKVATPEERNGQQVWVVELSTSNQTATVIVDAQTGEVLDMTVE